MTAQHPAPALLTAVLTHADILFADPAFTEQTLTVGLFAPWSKVGFRPVVTHPTQHARSGALFLRHATDSDRYLGFRVEAPVGQALPDEVGPHRHLMVTAWSSAVEGTYADVLAWATGLGAAEAEAFLLVEDPAACSAPAEVQHRAVRSVLQANRTEALCWAAHMEHQVHHFLDVADDALVQQIARVAARHMEAWVAVQPAAAFYTDRMDDLHHDWLNALDDHFVDTYPDLYVEDVSAKRTAWWVFGSAS